MQHSPHLRAPGGSTWRIALVSETYPPEINGVAGTIERVVHGLLDRGHTVQLLRPQRGEPVQRLRFEDVQMPAWPVPRYPELRMGRPCTRRLLALWQQQRPDIVHIATEGPLGASALRAARALGVPVTSDFRTNFHTYCGHYGLPWLRRPMLAWLRRFHNRCQATMVPTDTLRHELQGEGFERLQVVARGVDTLRFHPGRRSAELRARWGADADTPVLLFVGRLAPEKNLATLLQAWRLVQIVRPDAKLVCVGDGPARAELERQCPEAWFAGMQRGSELAAHYASADLFVFPSLTETFGNVVLEAMASGLPVLAFQRAAAAECIRTGHNGVLVPAGHAELFSSLAAQMVEAPQTLRRLGAAAHADACHWSWDSIVAQVEQVMRGALPAPAGGLALAAA